MGNTALLHFLYNGLENYVVFFILRTVICPEPLHCLFCNSQRTAFIAECFYRLHPRYLTYFFHKFFGNRFKISLCRHVYAAEMTDL